MNRDQALAFVQEHGVVLESATGPVACLAGAIAGEPLRGSWWSHPQAREIFALTRAVREHEDVLVCRLVGGKVTYVHRRLWPALVAAEERFARERLARVHERHTPSGRHVTEEQPFPGWVADDVAAQAARRSIAQALAELGEWCA